MSENNSDLGAFLAGFVIGGLVGAATALILAPQSGEETRNQIKTTGQNLSESSSAYIQEYGQKATDLAQPYREKATVAYSDAKNRLQESSGKMQDQAKSVGGKVQEQAKSALETSKEKASQVKKQVTNYIPTNDANADNAASGTA